MIRSIKDLQQYIELSSVGQTFPRISEKRRVRNRPCHLMMRDVQSMTRHATDGRLHLYRHAAAVAGATALVLALSSASDGSRRSTCAAGFRFRHPHCAAKKSNSAQVRDTSANHTISGSRTSAFLSLDPPHAASSRIICAACCQLAVPTTT